MRRFLHLAAMPLAEMRMARVICFVLLVADLVGEAAHAQSGQPWQHPPDIAVISSESDPRLSLVDEAISFWNRTLQEIGSCFKIGPVRRLVQPLPEEALQLLSFSGLAHRPVSIPTALRDPPGDIAIYLAASDFVSFISPPGAISSRVVGIRGLAFFPMNLPNVPRNVIAHLLGLAIGLRHNGDPRTLMCGRPASCRPDLFRSDEPHMFQLTEAERRQLLAMYPRCSVAAR
jgi:hypothetical protein